MPLCRFARLHRVSSLDRHKNCLVFVLYVLDQLMVVFGSIASCFAYKTTDTMIQILIQRFKVGGRCKDGLVTRIVLLVAQAIIDNRIFHPNQGLANPLRSSTV